MKQLGILSTSKKNVLGKNNEKQEEVCIIIREKTYKKMLFLVGKLIEDYNNKGFEYTYYHIIKKTLFYSEAKIKFRR